MLKFPWWVGFIMVVIFVLAIPTFIFLNWLEMIVEDILKIKKLPKWYLKTTHLLGSMGITDGLLDVFMCICIYIMVDLICYSLVYNLVIMLCNLF